MANAKEMDRGAVKGEVQVQTPETQDATDEDMVVLTTAPGTLSALGIVRAGTEATIHPRKFSENWMRPKTATDAKKLLKWQAAQNAD